MGMACGTHLLCGSGKIVSVARVVMCEFEAAGFNVI